jgi:hypothetical protein
MLEIVISVAAVWALILSFYNWVNSDNFVTREQIEQVFKQIGYDVSIYKDLEPTVWYREDRRPIEQVVPLSLFNKLLKYLDLQITTTQATQSETIITKKSKTK